jgi:DNA modification methylase
MATLIDTFPELKQAKKKSEIRKAGQSLQKLATALEGIKRIETANSNQTNTYTLENIDAREHMCKVPDASVDILLTDPLYGIGADLISMSVGGGTGGCFSTAGFKIEDPKEAAYFYYFLLAQQSFRFCTDKAHGYVFVGPEHFWKIREIFLAAGWLAYVKPIIWIKREVGQCNVPSAWPSSCYEMLMYIRRDNSRLVREGMPDWLECPPVPPSERKHPYEKPVKLLMDLLERVALPGQVLYDPFMGSGSSIEAGTKMKLFSTGTDIDKNAYAMALGRMDNVKT